MKSFYGVLKNPFKVLAWAITGNPLGRLLPDKVYLSIKYRSAFGKRLDWDNPKSFNEKLQWLKIYDRKSIYTTLVDKYEVKKYVASIIGEEYIIPTLGVWDKFDDIDFDKLPDQFVLKCTHDSGGLVICKDKKTFDKEAARKKINRCLKNNFYWLGREWPYKNVRSRIIAEKYMEDDTVHDLSDYKLFTFDGIAKALCFATEHQNEGKETKSDFFDAVTLEYLPYTNDRSNPVKLPKIPLVYQKMVVLAEKLSKDIPHLMTDFYEVNGKAYFGELTYANSNGLVPFEGFIWDEKFGEWIKLPESYGGGYALIGDKFVLWLHQRNDELSDYKIHCFSGVPKVILVCKDRYNEAGLSEDFFDVEWNHLDAKRPNHRNSDIPIPQPIKLKEMIALAGYLSKDFPFQRCDFYSVGGHIYFGEITFYPAGGFERFVPKEFDDLLGEWIELPAE